MVICKKVNIKNCIYRFHDNNANLNSLWLKSKLIIVVVLFNRDLIFKNAKYIQEHIAKL